METSAVEYDLRYLGGILFFNERDFFEAHEVWEDLWMTCAGPERRFYQGLIQAAVGLYHFGNGNLRGAVKLYHSSRDYMKQFMSPYLGLDIDDFWDQMARCFQEALARTDSDARVPLREELIPTIALEPAPVSWPNRADFEGSDE
jgi:predicted metal-dependent hydrolase